MSLTRWAALGAYVAAIYASLPFAPRVGLRFLRTAPGSWVLGPGLALVVLAGAAALVLGLRRRGAPARAYAALAVAAGAHHLERTHLPEYGIAAWLAWRAIAPLVPGPLAGYAAGAALAAAIGYGDELLQSIVPGRYYDIRDVGMNALGSVLAVIVIAATRAGVRRHEVVERESGAKFATHDSVP
ncbi:MAG: VanZ family protein [Deltaproteobacteria bacterium]|nr:MAG: VanZ family protein [Deltaproteobacteria bacterium]